MLLSTLGSGRPAADADDGNNDGVSKADKNEDTQKTVTREPSDTPGMHLFFWYLIFIRR